MAVLRAFEQPVLKKEWRFTREIPYWFRNALELKWNTSPDINHRIRRSELPAKKLSLTP
jgi:hypothetical protein